MDKVIELIAWLLKYFEPHVDNRLAGKLIGVGALVSFLPAFLCLIFEPISWRFIMFITFIIIVGLCLFAFGFFYMFNNRTAERIITVHGGDAYQAAVGRPRDKRLKKKGLEQEHNLQDLHQAHGDRLQAENVLVEKFDKQGELVLQRELRQHKHFAELAKLDTQQIAYRLKSERLQLDHYHSTQRKLGSASKLNEPGNPAMKKFKDQADYLVNFQEWHAGLVAQYGQAVADELKQDMQRWTDNQEFSQE